MCEIMQLPDGSCMTEATPGYEDAILDNHEGVASLRSQRHINSRGVASSVPGIFDPWHPPRNDMVMHQVQSYYADLSEPHGIRAIPGVRPPGSGHHFHRP